MDLNDRLVYLLIGVGIGFILGYITKALRNIEEELHEVDENVKKVKDEGGFIRFPIFANLALVTVLVVAVWASFAAEKNNDALVETQEELARQQVLIQRITTCNQMYLEQTVSALNERTTYSSDQARSNVKLVEAQARFLRILLTEPTPPEPVRRDALRLYFDPTVLTFIEFNERALAKFKANPYPTADDVNTCLNSED